MRKALLITLVIAIIMALTAATCEPTPAPTPAPTPVAPGAYLAGSLTSAQLANLVTNETGTGLLVLGTSPTITTPVITTINPSGSAIVTLPTATTTLVGRDTTDTLTNKTWNGASVGFSYLQATRGVTDMDTYTTTTRIITHGLGTTPTVITLNWTGTVDPTPVAASSVYLRSSSLGATTFTVNITAALSNRPSIAWVAIP